MNPCISSIISDCTYLSLKNNLHNEIKLSISETTSKYIISGYFPHFNQYSLNINYVNNFLVLDFFSKVSSSFRRMFYIENLNIDEVNLFFRNNKLAILINK